MKKTILITGCSTGIGLASTQILTQRGYHVIATTRTEADAQILNAQGYESYQLDLRDSEMIQAVVKKIQAQHTIGAVFHNAGYGQPGAVEDLSRSALQAQFEANLFGALELTNLILPAMRRQNTGRIIVNSSLLGIVAMPYRGAYNASKFAMEGLFDTLRLELIDTDIHVSIIEPGPIESQFRANAMQKFTENIDTATSPHQKKYQAMIRRLNAAQSPTPFTLPASAVVDKLILALESTAPKAHYPVTKPAYAAFWLRRILPTFLLDKIAASAGK